MRMRKTILHTFACCILLLTACKAAETKEVPQTPPPAAEPSSYATYDWLREEWHTDLTEGSPHPLYPEQYIDGLESDTTDLSYDYRRTFYCVGGNTLYALNCLGITLSDTGSMLMTCDLNCYDEETGEIYNHQFPMPQIPDSDDFHQSVSAIDIVNKEELILFVQLKQNETLCKYLAIHLSMDGKLLHMADLYPAMTENYISGQGNFAFEDIHTDSHGNYYLISDSGQEVLVLGTDGRLLDRWGSGENCEGIRFAMKDPDGNPVFEWYDPEQNTLQLAGYMPSSGEKTYAQIAVSPYLPKALSATGYLYYMDPEGALYRLDLRTGETAWEVNCSELGICRNPSAVRIAVGSAGEPLLMDFSGEKAIICRLSTEQSHQQTLIRLVSMTSLTTSPCEYVSACAADFSREQENCTVLVEKPQTAGMDLEALLDTEEKFRENALLELTAGKMADLYLVSAADMEMLYEKGALADLTGVLPQEMTSCIFPNVLDSGRIDGKLIGLSPEATASVAMVSNDIWPQDSWTLQEALDLLDAQPQLQYLLVHPRYNYGTGHLFQVFLQDLEHSPFLDLENGTCNFTDPLFIRLLEHVKDYGAQGSWESDPVKEGSAAGFYDTIHSYPYFTYLMSAYGDQFHPVGFPTDGGCGNYWNVDYYLVMNRNSPYRELIEEYLITLFDIEHQRICERAVRNDLLSRFTVYDEYSPDGGWQYDRGNGVYTNLDSKPDGSSWEQEYLALMNTCVQRSGHTEAIMDIIREEAESYFTGDKEAAEAAQIIQNRVQLYLNEQSR